VIPESLSEPLGTGAGKLWLLNRHVRGVWSHLLYADDIVAQLLKGRVIPCLLIGRWWNYCFYRFTRLRDVNDIRVRVRVTLKLMVSQSVSQPVSQSVSQSASQSVSQSASQSVSQSASQSVSQSVSPSVLASRPFRYSWQEFVVKTVAVPLLMGRPPCREDRSIF
jgi:hypothetical protein